MWKEYNQNLGLRRKMTGGMERFKKKRKACFTVGVGGPPKNSVASLFKVELQNSSQECQISAFGLIKYVLYLSTF